MISLLQPMGKSPRQPGLSQRIFDPAQRNAGRIAVKGEPDRKRNPSMRSKNSLLLTNHPYGAAGVGHFPLAALSL